MFDFEAMTNGKKKVLYECMWGNLGSYFLDRIEKKEYKGKISQNSYKFSGASTVDDEKCSDVLAELFQIADRDLFKRKFRQSVSGRGQELKRISTLHSSSLCALLFFYHVTEKNPYSMVLDGEEYVFTYSCFEYQNRVIENPSNMDVVLVGECKKSGTPVVLFLESKFSEYYEGMGKSFKGIATAYLDDDYSKPVYGSQCLADMGLHIVEEQGKPGFLLMSDKIAYVEGIKQMISHYVGVRNFCNDKRVTDNDKYIDTAKIEEAVSQRERAKILLGEILFDLPFEAGKNCFRSYQENYRILAGELNRQIAHEGKRGQIGVLNNVLSYSQFKERDCVKEERIKKFYFESGKKRNT